MEELLKHYGVNSIDELKELIKNNDERVRDLTEFLDYYNLKEMENQKQEKHKSPKAEKL